MIDQQTISEARCALGRQLASYRKRAGITQADFAQLVRYGRSTIACAETGRNDTGLLFWERADAVLKAHGALIRAYRELQALIRRKRWETMKAMDAERVARFRQADQSGDAVDTPPEPAPVHSVPHPVPPAYAPLGGPIEPWDRVAYGLRHPDKLDERTVEHLEWQTRELFRREEHGPHWEIANEVKAHLGRLSRLFDRAPEMFRQRLQIAYGESLALAGWLAWNNNRSTRAKDLYQRAEETARNASDGALVACVLAYRSHQAEILGQTRRAQQMLIEAQRYVGSRHHAATRAWVVGREAEVTASLGDASGALHALDRAVIAYDYANPHTERPWTISLTPGRLGSMAVTTYLRLEHSDVDGITRSVLAALSEIDTTWKAIVLADAATAAVRRDDHDKAVLYGHEAIQLGAGRPHRLITERLDALHRAAKDKRHIPALAELDDQLVSRTA